MNVGALPELILSWLKNQGMESLPADKDQAAAQFKAGMQYEGKVLDLLPNGRNLVQVGNQTLDMALPNPAKAGEVLRLTYLNAAPRPTFALSAPATPASAAQPVNVSPAAQQVSALVRYMPVSATAPVPTPAATVAVAGSVQTASPTGLATPAASSASTTPGSVPLAPAATSAVATAVATAGAAQAPTAQPGQPAPAAMARPTNAAATSTTATATTAVATAGAAQAAGRPIVANPAILLAPAPSAQAIALPGPAIPAMTLAGEAVDGLRGALGSQSSLVTAQGVVAEKAGTGHVLPMRLQQTVKESGLFYESHLGKWVRGELSLESVQREPQARLAQFPGSRLDLPDLEGMPEQAARLASRQLHMLDGGPFLWQGQAWPGQQAEWTVAERDAQREDFDGQKWHSNLRLTLPRLGEVAADLDVGALGLRIRLRAATPETLAAMRAAMPELVQRLRDADLNLSGIQADLADGRT